MRVAIIGGDRRMLYAAEAFLHDGFDVSVTGFETAQMPNELSNLSVSDAIAQSDTVILPVRPRTGDLLNAPFSDSEILLSALGGEIGNRPVFCGFAETVREFLHGSVYDYTAREEFSIRNAVLTAEGALGILIGESPDSLFGAETLVIGYGRIGRVLVRCLHALGAKVTVAARREESRAWARAEGCSACDLTLGDIGTYHMVVNTVPAAVITEKHLSAIRRGAVLLDLASAPGGIDNASADRYRVKWIHALGLPGKTAPAAAGRIIKDTISQIIKEENGGKDNSRLCDDRLLLHL